MNIEIIQEILNSAACNEANNKAYRNVSTLLLIDLKKAIDDYSENIRKKQHYKIFYTCKTTGETHWDLVVTAENKNQATLLFNSKSGSREATIISIETYIL
jgi:hypothetical protein